MSQMNIDSIHRFPIKGLQGESLEKTELLENASIEGDRAFAFAYQDALERTQDFDPLQNPKWISKKFLLQQRDWPAMASLKPSFDSSHKKLTLSSKNFSASCDTHSLEERNSLSQKVLEFMKISSPREGAWNPTPRPLVLLGNWNTGTRFTDGDTPPLSIGFIESLEDLERVSQTHQERDRFRLNIWIRGAKAWFENQIKTGTKATLGNAQVEFIKPIGRCPNIDVNPTEGSVDRETFKNMKNWLGHSVLGIKCRVLKSGIIRKDSEFSVNF